MGGCGSGRRTIRPSTDDCIRISLAELRREGAIRRHVMARRMKVWRQCGAIVAQLNLIVDVDCLELSPCLRITGLAFDRKIEQRLEIISQSQPLGGQRFYIRCPITRRRCCTLLLPPGGTFFASPRGWDVPYGSQRENRLDRALRATDKLKRRLDGLPKYTRKLSRQRLKDRLDQANVVIASEEARLVEM